MTAEPERELVRRVLPWAVPAAGLAYGLGWGLGGPDAGVSAALGIGVVAANLAMSGLSIAYAARISLPLLFGVALGGFAVRMAAIVLLLVLLGRLAWFSAPAFVAAVVPATLALLVVEMRLLSGRVQSELWEIPARPTGWKGIS